MNGTNNGRLRCPCRPAAHHQNPDLQPPQAEHLGLTPALARAPWSTRLVGWSKFDRLTATHPAPWAPRPQAVLPDTMVTIIHDIAVTEHWYVVVSGPLNFEPSKFLQDYVLGR